MVYDKFVMVTLVCNIRVLLATILLLQAAGGDAWAAESPPLSEPPTPSPRPAVPPPRVNPPPATGYNALTASPIEALKREELQLAAQLIKDFPRDHKAIGLVGNIHSRHGNHCEAKRYWRKALQLNPRDAHGYDALAMVSLLREEHEQAAALWRKAAEIDPNTPGVYYHLGQVLMALGKRQQAIEALNTDVEHFPGANPSHWLLGQLCMQSKQYEKAKEHYEAAIRTSPEFSKAHYGLAMACARLGQKDECRASLDKFKRLKAKEGESDRDHRGAYDDNSVMHTQVAQTCMQAGGIYYAHAFLWTAERLWKRAAALDAKQIASRDRLAVLYQHNGRNLEALAVCRQLKQLEPDSALRCMNLGVLLARLEQFDAARAELKEAYRLAPEHSGGYRLSAQMHLETGGDAVEALRLARRAVELEPIAPNYFVLGAACVKNGDRAAAREALQKAIALDPKNSKYRQTYELFRRGD